MSATVGMICNIGNGRLCLLTPFDNALCAGFDVITTTSIFSGIHSKLNYVSLSSKQRESLEKITTLKVFSYKS